MPIPAIPDPLVSAIGGDVLPIEANTPSGSGALSYAQGWPVLTGLRLEAGGIAPQREFFNAVNALFSQHLFFLQSGGVYPWRDDLNYLTGWRVLVDGQEYTALSPSGPDIPDVVGVVGPKPPAANPEYWGKTGDLPITTRPQFDATTAPATTEFVRRALGNLRGLASANASTALTLAEVGKLFAFYGSAANQTLTLPDLRTLAVGAGYHIVNQASVPVRIAAAAGQSINVNTLAGVAPAAAMEIGPGDAICITSNASPANPLWNVLGIARNNAFPASLVAGGSQLLPSGLRLKWGSGTYGAATSVTFPEAFPEACFAVVIGPGNYDATAAAFQKVVAIAAYNETRTGFLASSANDVARRGLWLALGK